MSRDSPSDASAETLICRPGDSHRSAVDPTGGLVVRRSGHADVHMCILPPWDETDVAVEQFTEDPRVPIVSTSREVGNLRLDLRAIGHIDEVGRRLDIVRWRLWNRAPAALTEASLSVEFAGGHLDVYADHEWADDANASRAETDDGAARRRVLRTRPTDIEASMTSIGTIAVLLSGPPLPRARLEPGWVAKAFRRERRFWIDDAFDDRRFRVPDRSVMDRVMALRRVALQRGDDPADAVADDDFTRGVQASVVRDTEAGLELLSGIPNHWLQPGAELVVVDAATRFGSISVSAIVTGSNDLIVSIEPAWVEQPGQVVVWAPSDTIDAAVDGHRVSDPQSPIAVEPAASTTIVCTRPPTSRVVEGHEATKAALRNWSTYSSACPFKPDIRDYPQLPIESDRPDHGDYRAILEPWFRRSRLAEHEPAIRAVAVGIVRDFATTGRAEAVRDLALPMVVRSLAITLGRPQDVDESLGWGVAMNVVHGFRDGRQTDEYIARVLDEATSHPTDDVFGAIATASVPDRRLTRREQVGLASMVLTAGRAATVNLLAGALWILATRPHERARLAADTDLIPAAVEEMLRYLSPVPEMTRVVATDADPDIDQSHVAVSFASANYDPTVFAQPEILDLDRRPSAHIAFGTGPHFCLGANLARMEARLLIEELLDAQVDFTLDSDPEMSWYQLGSIDVPGDFQSVPLVATPLVVTR